MIGFVSQKDRPLYAGTQKIRLKSICEFYEVGGEATTARAMAFPIEQHVAAAPLVARAQAPAD
jgi:hypothetical protein